MSVSILEKATAALLKKNPQELEVAAASLLTLVLDGKSELVEPFFIVVEALPNKSAVAVLRDAANNAALGSAFEQRAVAGIMKHAEELTDVAALVAANRDMANNAPFGSMCQQLAEIKLKTLLPQKPTRPDEIPAFVQRFVTPAQSG
jgi:hypothetical protein